MFPDGGGARIFPTIIAVGLVLMVMMLRNSRPRKLRVELLWLRPILFAIIVMVTLSASRVTLDAASIAVLALAMLIGAGLGWQRGRFMRIEVDPDTHALTSRASPIGILFIVAILGLRIMLRGAAVESQSALGIPATTITDSLVVLLGAMVVTQSLEMWLRARRLLEEARAAKAAIQSPGLQPPLIS